MKPVEGSSPHAAYDSDESHSARVTVRVVSGESDAVELRIGQGKRARIVRLESRAARRLAYALIEAITKVAVNEAKSIAFDKGIDLAIGERRKRSVRGTMAHKRPI